MKKKLKKFFLKLEREKRETYLMFLFFLGYNKNKKNAIEQFFDIGKMFFLGAVFMIPFIGSLSTAFLLKKFKNLRPSSFR